MKKKFKLQDLDCANCAAKMEESIKKIDGVNDAVVSFMTQKMTVDADDAHFDEIMDFYLSIYPQKKNYYDDIMRHKDIVFTQSIPVFTTLLRPTKLDNAGSLKYEKTNENYNLLAHLVYQANNDKLVPDRQKKNKYEVLYDIQVEFNALYTELKEILEGKKGDLRSSIGGRLTIVSLVKLYSRYEIYCLQQYI